MQDAKYCARQNKLSYHLLSIGLGLSVAGCYLPQRRVGFLPPLLVFGGLLWLRWVRLVVLLSGEGLQILVLAEVVVDYLLSNGRRVRLEVLQVLVAEVVVPLAQRCRFRLDHFWLR